jgi:hypothetical protein
MRAERINALARICGAKRYLEVGVAFGETFFDVKIPYKVAVDPMFRFDYAQRADSNTKFHAVPSDQFFEVAEPVPFDIIYLDGLHTYEQTTRDFLNSLRVAHDKTIWVIDDTVPNDVFSANPDQEKCYRLRKKLGGDDWSWMGDVFKCVFFIDRALPFFHFRTFGGHGQTVLWRSNRPRSVGAEGVGLDQIGAMTYEDMIEHLEAMRIADDDQILKAVSEALT